MKNSLIAIAILASLCSSLSAQRKVAEEARIREQFDYSFNDIRNKLVVIEHELGSGSGFIATMDGKTYLLTNQHVILGGEKINFTTASGKKLRPRKVELSATRNIARLLLDTESGFEITDQIEMNVPIGVFGNSEGAGVAIELYGMVTGAGGGLVEVSAEFVSGNSGSPVLNLDQKAIGIASYVRYSLNSKIKKGTQFEGLPRRFCYRLTGVQWQAVRWNQYNNSYGKLYLQSKMLIEGVYGVISDITLDAVDMINVSDNLERSLNSWANTHNRIIADYKLKKYHNRGFPIAYSGSMRTLAGICRGRARQLHMLSKKDDLTGFLRQRLKQQSGALEDLAKEFNRYGDSIHL